MKFITILFLAIFSSLAQAEFDVIDVPSENFGCNEKNTGRGDLKPCLLVAHCMGTEFNHSLQILTLPVDKGGGGVSAHYFIPQMTGREIVERFPEYVKGQKLLFPDQVPVFRLVKEEDRAWHAGPSRWGSLNLLPGCAAGLNSCSIGIEFHSPGYANGDGSNWFAFKSYSEGQIETARELISDIYRRWNLPKCGFLGHSDLTPARKTDPGLHFPWERFAAHGFGMWWQPAAEMPEFADSTEITYVQKKLQTIGYDCPQTGNLDELTQRTISAFRMHFMKETWKCSNGQENDGLLNGHIDGDLIRLLAGYSDRN
ncbi:MAG: N-acetylmuramoyl-L-alanine amidase [Bdellovibrio sp.]|nr:N-acetylmuramoyl-L-alanine amidase [Bdellovibrio sp.]